MNPDFKKYPFPYLECFEFLRKKKKLDLIKFLLKSEHEFKEMFLLIGSKALIIESLEDHN